MQSELTLNFQTLPMNTVTDAIKWFNLFHIQKNSIRSKE